MATDDSEPTAREAEGSPREHRSGFVALCGRPNVGKSTLLNAMLEHELAVVSAHPQTTRERQLGIWNREDAQIIFVDTPGIHRPRSELNRFMVAQAQAAIAEVELVLMLAEVPVLPDVDAARAWTPGPVARDVLAQLAERSTPVVLVLTKVDRIGSRELLLPLIETWTGLHAFAAVIPTSATTGEGVEALRQEVLDRVPVGPKYYDADDLSDRSLRWHAGELIRVELFEHLGQELPYSCAVEVDGWKERPQRDTVTATLYVERDSQKGMVIGRGAAVIKAISMGARRRIEALTGRPCDLKLEVGVSKNWTRDPKKLARFGYAHSPSRSERK